MTRCTIRLPGRLEHNTTLLKMWFLTITAVAASLHYAEGSGLIKVGDVKQRAIQPELWSGATARHTYAVVIFEAALTGCEYQVKQRFQRTLDRATTKTTTQQPVEAPGSMSNPTDLLPSVLRGDSNLGQTKETGVL